MEENTIYPVHTFTPDWTGLFKESYIFVTARPMRSLSLKSSLSLNQGPGHSLSHFTDWIRWSVSVAGAFWRCILPYAFSVSRAAFFAHRDALCSLCRPGVLNSYEYRIKNGLHTVVYTDQTGKNPGYPESQQHFR